MHKNLPPEYLERMQSILGHQYQDFLAIYESDPSVGIRVNTLKITIAEFKDLFLTDKLTPLPWCSSGFYLPEEARPGKHPYHAAGLYYIQDPSAMVIGEALSPKPGEKILDLTAAPGGKTTHLASLMKNSGFIIANDINSRRIHALDRNISRWGARNIVITNETPGRLAEHFGAFFDRVLVDAPCSGEGMFRKDKKIKRKWTLKNVQYYREKQSHLLSQAAMMVRLGGVIVYSTCTFSPEENEEVITRFLSHHKDFEIESLNYIPGSSPGLSSWNSDDSPNQFPNGTIRMWPHLSPGEGHFAARLKRKQADDYSSFMGVEKQSFQGPIEKAQSTTDFQHFNTFMSQNITSKYRRENVSLIGSNFYQIPARLPDLRGLNVIHWGWWLGTRKKGRFEPSHAFAMGLSSEEVIHKLSFNLDDHGLRKFIRGDVQESAGLNGWVLVTINGYPIGWGKRVNGRLKSRIPAWLRQ